LQLCGKFKEAPSAASSSDWSGSALKQVLDLDKLIRTHEPHERKS